VKRKHLIEYFPNRQRAPGLFVGESNEVKNEVDTRQ
jgi:hypothetical protein